MRKQIKKCINKRCKARIEDKYINMSTGFYNCPCCGESFQIIDVSPKVPQTPSASSKNISGKVKVRNITIADDIKIINHYHDSKSENCENTKKEPPAEKVKLLQILYWTVGILVGICTLYGFYSSVIAEPKHALKKDSIPSESVTSSNVTEITKTFSPTTTAVHPAVTEPITQYYTVKFSVIGDNGAITDNVDNCNVSAGKRKIEQSKDISFTATPNTGYCVKEWRKDNTVIPGNKTYSYTLNNLMSDSSVTVEFEPVQYKGTLEGISGNGILWIYYGDIFDGKAHGEGKMTWDDGNCWYDGSWAYGVRTKGLYKNLGGDLYEGEFLFEDGRYFYHGKGKMTWKNGDYFDGDWDKDYPTTGSGVRTGTNSSGISWKYVGDLYNGMQNGKGKMTWENGDYFDGDWVMGLRHGEGTYYYASNGEVDKGRWENDVFAGK